MRCRHQVLTTPTCRLLSKRRSLITLAMLLALLAVAAAKRKAAPAPLAIVNARLFHSEVLMGALEALRPLARRTAVYVHPYVAAGKDGVRSLVGSYPRPLLPTPAKNSTGKVPHHAVVFFISPGSTLAYTRFFIRASQPHTVVHMIHDADDPATDQLLALHPRTRLVALSPHVVAALQQRGFRADWWLAAWPARASCPSLRNGTLLAPWGFVCQGRIDSRRRSYDSLWEELQAAADAEAMASGRGAKARSSSRAASASAAATSLGAGSKPAPPAPRLKLLGRTLKAEGPLAIPAGVRHLVTKVTNAPYKRFFDHIACSHALLPLFANDTYLTTKFSSTILASLSAGTPILADGPLLAAYSFLTERSAFLRGPEEGLVEAMQRVQALPPAAHAARRGALAVQRNRVNLAARRYLIGLLAEAKLAEAGAARAAGQAAAV